MTPERRAWHFTGVALRDGRPIPAVGEWLVHNGEVVICNSGLHASERLLDALRYAPGLTLHRVTCEDVVGEQEDKLVCRRRRIDSSCVVPMRAVVRLAIESACLAAWCAGLYLPDLLVALEACDREDWDAAAANAAQNATWAAARGAWNAAGAAAANAAWNAAGAAAWNAAGAAQNAAGAAQNAAWAAWNAAQNATWAAWNAAGAAAWNAAGDALEARAVALLWGDADDT